MDINILIHNFKDAPGEDSVVQAVIARRQETVPPLIEALKDTDGVVRLKTAEALGSISDKAAIPALTEALHQDTSPAVRDH